MKNGIRIKNISAAMLYEVNLGVRDYFTYTAAVLHNSLFSDYLKSIGMKVRNESTRDVICINFDFGSRSYEEERKRLDKLLEKTPEEDRAAVLRTIEKVEGNRDKYCAKTYEELRTEFYENDVDVTYKNRDGTVQEVITYRMLYRTSAKAKLGHAVFINVKLYKKAYDWLTMGIGKRLGKKNVKIVELSAYAPLTTSTIIDKIHIPVEDILILKDQDSWFRTMTKVVRAESYETRKGPSKKCVVDTVESDVKNTLWDGMGLIETSYFPEYANGMMLLRNHFFKMCGVRTKIQMFLREWCEDHGIDYETFQIQDMFGVWHRAADIKVITTDNAIKWKKFIENMGGDPTSAYEYWKDRINADGSYWGVVKTDHPSKLGSMQQMSYQMINTLPCAYEDINNIAADTMSYVVKLKEDDDAFIEFLKEKATTVNHYEMMAALAKWNPDIMQTYWFCNERKKIITSFVKHLRSGKIMVEGDNLTVFGNPYALLLYAVGGDYMADPTLRQKPGIIQCYTPRFAAGEYLAAFRNPHNSPNNIMYLHNVYSPEFDRYFEFSNNILAVNCIGTDIQDRSNGCDFDSDFFFVTNQETMVEQASYCYQHYPTIVNALKESGITYDNTRAEYARMDNKFAKSRLGIGWSSNLALLATTYYWTELSKEQPDPEKVHIYYDNFVILSVLAQILIDSCKREYEIDGMEEIKRIQGMEEMAFTEERDGKMLKKDFPEFMKYTRDIPVMKNQQPRPYEDIKNDRELLNRRINYNLTCPMNWLQDFLNMIPNATRRQHIPIEDLFIKMDGKPNHRQMIKILDIIEEYSRKVTEVQILAVDREAYLEILTFELDEVIERLRKIKITNLVTINRILETALSMHVKINQLTATDRSKKYTRTIMNLLYRMNPEKFLGNFTREHNDFL